MAALRGDTSDGLPGIAGIGEKTAARLIERYGDLAALRAAIEGGDPALKGAQRARLEAGLSYLEVAPLVVRVAHDAPVPEHDGALPTQVADPDLLGRLAEDYGLTSSFTRVLTALDII
jgi:5'-3' exonuclease